MDRNSKATKWCTNEKRCNTIYIDKNLPTKKRSAIDNYQITLSFLYKKTAAYTIKYSNIKTITVITWFIVKREKKTKR